MIWQNRQIFSTPTRYCVEVHKNKYRNQYISILQKGNSGIFLNGHFTWRASYSLQSYISDARDTRLLESFCRRKWLRLSALAVAHTASPRIVCRTIEHVYLHVYYLPERTILYYYLAPPPQRRRVRNDFEWLNIVLRLIFPVSRVSSQTRTSHFPTRKRFQNARARTPSAASSSIVSTFPPSSRPIPGTGRPQSPRASGYSPRHCVLRPDPRYRFPSRRRERNFGTRRNTFFGGHIRPIYVVWLFSLYSLWKRNTV